MNIALPLNYLDDRPASPLSLDSLKALHRAARGGSPEEMAQLSERRDKIISLNEAIKQGTLQGIDPSFQIALPQTGFERMVEVATAIPRLVCSILLDLALLPLAAFLIALMYFAPPQFDPTNPKKDTIPILLLHGSGFNESEWILGRQFLNKGEYGSLFSLNFDGLVSNDPAKGLNDYAEKISAKMQQIRELTGQSRCILIGHSMGGMVGGYYAEYLAERDEIEVPDVISIGSPWQGAPLLDHGGEEMALRYQHMSRLSPTRQQLVRDALASERAGKRRYYNIGSTVDLMVPAPASDLTEDPRRQRTFSYLGHYGLIVSPSVWLQVRAWLNEIYRA